MPPVGFEPPIPASARPQTYALDRAATGIGWEVGKTGYVGSAHPISGIGISHSATAAVGWL
jgi:hypothetical protein